MPCFFVPSGPLGFIVVAGLYVMTVPVKVGHIASHSMEKIKRSYSQNVTSLFDTLVPSVIESRISTYSRYISMYSALRSKQTVSQWHTIRAKYEMIMNQLEEAQKDLQLALQMDATNTDAMFQQALIAVVQGNHNMALQLLHDTVQIMTCDKQQQQQQPSGIKQAFHSLEKGYAKVKAGFLHHIRDNVIMVANAVQPDAHVADHVTRKLQQDAEEYKQFDQIEHARVTLHQVYTARALCAYFVSNYDLAMSDYKNVLQLSQKVTNDMLVHYWHMTGNCLFYKEQYKEAIQQWNKILVHANQLPAKFVGKLNWMQSYAYYMLRNDTECTSKQIAAECTSAEQPFLWRMLPIEILALIFAFSSFEDRLNLQAANLMFTQHIKLADELTTSMALERGKQHMSQELLHAVEHNLCTHHVTGDLFVQQVYYECNTCSSYYTTRVVCLTCAKLCHSGHTMSVAKFGKVFCDCPASIGSCQASPNNVETL